MFYIRMIVARPYLNERNLKLGNALERGGRWILDHGSMVTISLVADGSGDDEDPYVRFSIDWGDGDIDVSDGLPVGREFIFHHQYSDDGEYIVKAMAINGNGERSLPTPYHTALLRVMAQDDKKRSLYKWSGIALPNGRISQSLSVQEDVYPVQTYRLTVPMVAGSMKAVLHGVGDQAFAADSEITIWQAGRLITAGRITSQNLNIVEIDIAAASDYDEHATVEVRQRPITREYLDIISTSHEWAFPKSRDEDLVRASIACLLGTRPLERVMRPKIGSRLPELAFQPNDVLSKQLAFSYTSDVLRAFEPRISLKNVRYENKDNDISIGLTFSFRDARQELFEAVVPLSMDNTSSPY